MDRRSLSEVADLWIGWGSEVHAANGRTNPRCATTRSRASCRAMEKSPLPVSRQQDHDCGCDARPVLEAAVPHVPFDPPSPQEITCSARIASHALPVFRLHVLQRSGGPIRMGLLTSARLHGYRPTKRRSLSKSVRRHRQRARFPPLVDHRIDDQFHHE
jgi:hypothetical protein